MSRDLLWKFVDVIVIDGVINGSARSVAAMANTLRKIQSGVAQNYAVLMMAGIVLLVAIMVYPMIRP
jgi:NADH-quinone oxidoreductase subunit L